MGYAEEFFEKTKAGTATVDDLLEFLDLWMADVEGRHKRDEERRQANKCCGNCRWFNEGCDYWGGGEMDKNDYCGQWR